MRTLLLAAVASAVTFASLTTEASPSWSTPVAGCKVTAHTTAHPPTIDARYGEVDFTGTDTGTITLVCRVTNAGSPGSLNLTYNNSGPSFCTLNASLNFHSLTGPTSGSISSVTATNGFGANSLGSSSATVSTPLDFSLNFYWVAVTMSRTGTVSACSANTTWLN